MKNIGQEQVAENRNIELNVLNKILKVVSKETTQDIIFKKICNCIPEIFQHPEKVSVRINFENKTYTSRGFEETKDKKIKLFSIPGDKNGSLEIFNIKDEFDYNSFLDNIIVILTGAISKYQLSVLSYEIKERLKELKGINLTASILKEGTSIEEALSEVCSFLPEAWQYPEQAVARITFENKVFTSKKFRETKWRQKQDFETPDGKTGSIEVFYLKEFPNEDEGPFLSEERNLIDNLASLISGTASKKALTGLLSQNTERLKELRGINQASAILSSGKDLEESLQTLCTILPEAWQYPAYCAARITFGNKQFKTDNFKETPWIQSQDFAASQDITGKIEIAYLKSFPDADEGPFLKEERNLLINLANLISGTATKEVFNQLQRENKERIKELWGINQTSQIIAEGKSIDETLGEICSVIPSSWQYPRHTTARIVYEDKVYTSKRFKVTKWSQKEFFVTIDNNKGSIEIFYLKEFPAADEGPFLKEERNLLINLSKLICGYINNFKGREFYSTRFTRGILQNKAEDYRRSLIKDKQPLQLFFNKQIIDKYIYFDMMKYKVKEILFVATLYDAFMLENEDNFFEQFMGEIYQYSLFSLPRITGVTSPAEALEMLETTHFDLVVLMAGIDQTGPIELSKIIKKKKPELSIYLLLNQKSNTQYFEEIIPNSKSIDKLFVWNGDSQIFFAIVKSIEDKANVENDTKIGLVRVILLIEDSAQYYSKYLPILYSIVFGQIQQLLVEVEKNELDKIAKMRSRPKIIHVRNYEEAIYIFHKYKDFFLCVISDVEFEKEGKLNKTAGLDFIRYVQSHIKNLPIILQSSDVNNKPLANQLGVGFINKNSESLLSDLKKFITYNLAFGGFVFRDKNGDQIAVARSLSEFIALLHTIPEESLYYHAVDNQFSLWIMGRGEIQLAKELNPIKISNFNSLEEFRHFLISSINNYLGEKKKGKILNFDDTIEITEKNIVTLSSGSIGGKGRGLAFINTLIHNLNLLSLSSKINIKSPKTVIIGTDEFETFLESNDLYEKLYNPNLTFSEIKEYFSKGNLTPLLVAKLNLFIDQVKTPIAVRSSSLSEDSITQPFAGVFDTYIIPNNHPNKAVRVDILVHAIKMVYASVYSDSARTYFKAIDHKVEEERMAVVLQELVGQNYENYYYPHISGVASSYNFYAVSHMKPDEGFAVAALGLGSYVVDGGKSYRFSAKYPHIQMFSTKDLINSTQTNFFAVDMTREDYDLVKDGTMACIASLDISEAEKHATLKHIASVYNPVNDVIEDGLSAYGPRIINFADILKHNYIPLAETIDTMLQIIKEALGCPVEIEYAVDMTPSTNDLPTFYLLQIKPLIENQLNFSIDLKKINESKIMLYTGSSLGNGQLNNIKDLIFVDIDKFDKLKTIEMVDEIDELNKQMIAEGKKYILIGPGRWGTRDRFIGIPVSWAHISNAKVIVEVSLENFPLDSSLGSHFFHNVTSMNVGYLSVQNSSASDRINWDLIYKQKLVKRSEHFIHVQFDNPLSIIMDGKTRTSVIFLNS